MTNVIPLRRPAVPAPSPRPSSSVRLVLDDGRGVHVAVCDRCTDTETAYLDSLSWLLDWADTHHCDPELAALLSDICTGRAA